MKTDIYQSGLLDMVIAFFLLILTLPLILICFVLIKLDSEGGAIFRQERLGLKKKPFVVYKFRTMVPNAEQSSGPVWAQKGDPRITSIGNFLRKSRLDELPQLLNVLKGEMNIIGCRPIRKHFADQLREEIEGYDRRFEVKPGLTGWAQVNETYANSVEAQKKKFELEIYYLENKSFLLDLKILLLTLLVPFKEMGV